MSAKTLSGTIEFDEKDRDFWTFGETINGNLILKAVSDTYVELRSIQGSILCEEWVHTVHLEFKEHYRGTASILAPLTDAIRVEPDSSYTVPFSLQIPREKQKKYPPSFEFRYNNVAWCVKLAIGFISAGQEESQTAQFEKSFRLCTLHPSGQASVFDPSTDLNVIEFDWCPTYTDFKPPKTQEVEGGHIINNNNNNQYYEFDEETINQLQNLSLNLRLTMYQCGLVQSPAVAGRESGLHLYAKLDGVEQMEINGITVEVIEYMHTYGKDSLLLPKSIEHRKLVTTLHQGEVTDLSSFVEGIQIHGLTEDFRTEWQQITHSLRLHFDGSLAPQQSQLKPQPFSLSWQIPVKVLSEAEAID